MVALDCMVEVLDCSAEMLDGTVEERGCTVGVLDLLDVEVTYTVVMVEGD